MQQNTESGTQLNDKPYLIVGAVETKKEIKLGEKDYIYFEVQGKGRVITAEMLYDLIFEKMKIE